MLSSVVSFSPRRNDSINFSQGCSYALTFNIQLCNVHLNFDCHLGAFFGLLTHCELPRLRLSLMVILVQGPSVSSSSSTFPFPSSSSGSSFFTSVLTVMVGGGSIWLDVLPSLCFSLCSSGSALTVVSPEPGDTLSLMVTV